MGKKQVDPELIELSETRAENIDDALDGMRRGLNIYRETNDRRAIFLRLYYMMTLEVYKAIHGCPPYRGRQIFMDPHWVYELSGKFSTLYFESLRPGKREPGQDRAWQLAYTAAANPASSVVKNALLGINAHINYDLPRAIAANLEGDDLTDYELMHKRKFDHDQVNNLLIRTVNPVQKVLSRNYEPGVAIADRFLGGLDERACGRLLREYRERVWWNALSYAAAKPGPERQIVHYKLEWESYQLAKSLNHFRLLWGAERVVDTVARPLIGRRWAQIGLQRRCHDHRDEPPPASGAAVPVRPLDEIGCSASSL